MADLAPSLAIMKAAESLGVPVYLLSRWQRRRVINLKAIEGGWHMVINKESAATVIMEAARR